MEQVAVFYALGANVFFALASIGFTSFSKRISVQWVNYLKSSVAAVLFLLFALATHNFLIPNFNSIGFLFLSGVLGLCIGDMFLLKSFTVLGPGRTLILFSFHPLFTGFTSYFLFDQALTLNQFLAILTMVSCLFILGREKIDNKKSWSFGPLVFALVAIALDATGVILTRQAFEMSPTMDSSMANLIRALSCSSAFFVWSMFRPIRLVDHFKSLSTNSRILVLISCTLGTFVSLMLYLNAIKYGHLATISAIASTGPLWATVFEFVFFKQKPTRSLLYTFLLFIIGMILLNS